MAKRSNAEVCREQYAKHREKRLAAKRAEYAADPEKMRARNRSNYAKHQAARRKGARAYRATRLDALAQKALARYHDTRPTILERRAILRRRPEARAKAYAAMRQWLKENPDKALLQHAKRLIAERNGIRVADVPNELAAAKVEQILITRWVRAAIVDTRPKGQDGEAGLGLPSGDGAAQQQSPENCSPPQAFTE